MGRGKFKGKPTGQRHFSTPEQMLAGTSTRPRTFKREEASYEAENPEVESEEESEEEDSETEKRKGTQGLIEIENPNLVKPKHLRARDVDVCFASGAVSNALGQVMHLVGKDWTQSGVARLFSAIKHLLRVVPVIGILSDKRAFKLTPNPAEVEAVFDAPLEMFIKDENRRVEEREWMGEHYLIHFFDYETANKKFVIWGLTAGILIRAALVVYQWPPAFVEQNPKFKFPRGANVDTVMR